VTAWDGVLPEAWRGKRVGWIGLSPPPQEGVFAQVECLAPEGDLRVAASRLFAAMRRLDSAGLDGIIAQLVPETGLGRAINDRLLRAGGVA
jgi:L-threonylcarbamoyladenylate synthase